MGTMRGDRFNIDLSSEDEIDADSRRSRDMAGTVSMIKDVQERPRAPSSDVKAPSMKTHQSGFPAHTKRATQSMWKTRRLANPRQGQRVQDDKSPGVATPSKEQEADPIDSGVGANEEREIDRENRQKLASMSDEEIAFEREELLKGLDPNVLRTLMQRNRDETGSADDTGERKAEVKASHLVKRVAFDETSAGSQSETEPSIEDVPKPTKDLELSNVHFPKPSQPKELNPEDPSFFDSLHAKYFPSLPSEPSKLSWMRSSSTSTYDPDQASVKIAELRFDFQGAFIAPRKASEIPVTAGLHHHGDAPDSAGYTVPELAHLARSSVPMQRCIAFQTLGRLMYRLGIGELGEPTDSIPKGVSRMLKEGRILDSLQEAASTDAGHVSAKAHATEALWLWRRGGGSSMEAA